MGKHARAARAAQGARAASSAGATDDLDGGWADTLAGPPAGNAGPAPAPEEPDWDFRAAHALDPGDDHFRACYQARRPAPPPPSRCPPPCPSRTPPPRARACWRPPRHPSGDNFRTTLGSPFRGFGCAAGGAAAVGAVGSAGCERTFSPRDSIESLDHSRRLDVGQL